MTSFGNTNPASSTPSLSGNNTTASTGSTSLFGTSTTTSAKSSSLFGNAPSGTTSTGLNLGTTSTPGLFNSPTAGPTSVPATTSLFGAKQITASSTPSLFSGAIKPAFTLGKTTTTSSTPNLGFPLSNSTAASTTTTASTTAPTFSLGSAPAPSTISTQLPSQAPSTVSSYTYKQVEDLINKWSTELEEQEQMFMRQANQVNMWDRLLMDNAEQITDLNNEVEKVKADQQRLNHDLDFIDSQQQELEAMLQPLEEKIKSSNMTINNQYSDNEREKTYSLAESIDSQLKQMSGDIKEVIEHLNSVNSSANDENNPMYQISRILNMHMDALVWIDQNSNVLQKRVDEVSSICDQRKQEQEKNFRMAFE